MLHGHLGYVLGTSVGAGVGVGMLRAAGDFHFSNCPFGFSNLEILNLEIVNLEMSNLEISNFDFLNLIFLNLDLTTILIFKFPYKNNIAIRKEIEYGDSKSYVQRPSIFQNF